MSATLYETNGENNDFLCMSVLFNMVMSSCMVNIHDRNCVISKSNSVVGTKYVV